MTGLWPWVKEHLAETGRYLVKPKSECNGPVTFQAGKVQWLKDEAYQMISLTTGAYFWRNADTLVRMSGDHYNAEVCLRRFGCWEDGS